MCHQSSCTHLSAEEAISAEERLLLYCKPVELYNILHRRAQHNVISCILFVAGNTNIVVFFFYDNFFLGFIVLGIFHHVSLVLK